MKLATSTAIFNSLSFLSYLMYHSQESWHFYVPARGWRRIKASCRLSSHQSVSAYNGPQEKERCYLPSGRYVRAGEAILFPEHMAYLLWSPNTLVQVSIDSQVSWSSQASCISPCFAITQLLFQELPLFFPFSNAQTLSKFLPLWYDPKSGFLIKSIPSYPACSSRTLWCIKK